MLTTGCRTYLAAAAAFLVTAWVYGWSTGAGYLLGPITMGYKGGVGEHFGYTVLLGSAVCSFLLGVLLVALRDAEVSLSDEGAVEDVKAVPVRAETSSVHEPSPWPLLAVSSIGVVLVGLVFNAFIVAIGLGALAVSIVAWAQQSVSGGAQPSEHPVGGTDVVAYVPPPLPVALVAGGRVFAAASFFGGLLFTLYALSQNVAEIFLGPVVIGLAIVARAVIEWYADTETPQVG